MDENLEMKIKIFSVGLNYVLKSHNVSVKVMRSKMRLYTSQVIIFTEERS